jgi:acetyl-CoA carboxylase carboxyl transferase subunit alpha
VITFIDTPGAYPGIDAEERGQSNAIAENLALMSRLRTPIISTVIGEGGSGGALAIGVCDQLMMLQYSTYAVISPEGCASILWKSASHAQEAAAAMGITASRLLELGLIDQMISEPEGGAHRNVTEAAAILKQALKHQLLALLPIDLDTLLAKRFEKFRDIGRPL